MRSHRLSRRLAPVHLRHLEGAEPSASVLSEGLWPVVVLLVVALLRLAAFAYRPIAWGTEESIALAFALGAAYLLTHDWIANRLTIGDAERRNP